MNEVKNEAEEIVTELNERHKDVLQPVIQRINECYEQHDGDSMFYLLQALVSLTQSIHELLQRGEIISRDAPKNGFH